MKIYRKKSIKDLIPDEIILHPIYGNDGVLFLKRYSVITNSIIIKLKKYFPSSAEIIVTHNLKTFEIFEDSRIFEDRNFLESLKSIVGKFNMYTSEDLDFEDYIDERAELNKEEIVLVNDHKENKTELEKFYNYPLWESFKQIFDSQHLINRISIIKQLFFERIEQEQILKTYYKELESYHEALEVSSINTCIVSIMIGLTLELRDEQLIELAIASLFANIGFIRQSKDEYFTYVKDGEHTETTIKHIKNSVEIISSSYIGKRKNIVMGILDHHECVDGSGLPNKKLGNQIHLFAKIISISKLYDQLVRGFFGRKTMKSTQALQYIWEQRGRTLDKNIVKVFIYRTNIFKINEEYTLPDNRTGKIIGFTDYINFPLFPIILLNNGEIRDLYFERKKPD
jgi:HD-GYP domain-containing protein (c-di-GMP phosphodiesterase class II)